MAVGATNKIAYESILSFGNHRSSMRYFHYYCDFWHFLEFSRTIGSLKNNKKNVLPKLIYLWAASLGSSLHWLVSLPHSGCWSSGKALWRWAKSRISQRGREEERAGGRGQGTAAVFMLSRPREKSNFHNLFTLCWLQPTEDNKIWRKFIELHIKEHWKK